MSSDLAIRAASSARPALPKLQNTSRVGAPERGLFLFMDFLYIGFNPGSSPARLTVPADDMQTGAL